MKSPPLIPSLTPCTSITPPPSTNNHYNLDFFQGPSPMKTITLSLSPATLHKYPPSRPSMKPPSNKPKLLRTMLMLLVGFWLLLFCWWWLSLATLFSSWWMLFSSCSCIISYCLFPCPISGTMLTVSSHFHTLLSCLSSTLKIQLPPSNPIVDSSPTQRCLETSNLLCLSSVFSVLHISCFGYFPWKKWIVPTGAERKWSGFSETGWN